MKVRRDTEGAAIVTLLEIEPFFLDLLRRIRESGDPGDDPAAQDRLFSSPVEGGETEIQADWEEYVQPEIRDLFRSAQEIVESDLAGLPQGQVDWTGEAAESQDAAFAPTEYTLAIPREHAGAWMSALNQARLVIAAKRGFEERDMEEGLPLPPFDERQFDLFQIHFYDYLQELLLQGTGYGG